MRLLTVSVGMSVLGDALRNATRRGLHRAHRAADGSMAIDWLLSAIGKGGRRRQVPVPAEFVDELGDELARAMALSGTSALSATGAFTCWPASPRGHGPQPGPHPGYPRRSRCFSRRPPTTCKALMRSSSERRAPIGCGIRMGRMRCRAGRGTRPCRFRWCRTTWGMHRWGPLRCT